HTGNMEAQGTAVPDRGTRFDLPLCEPSAVGEGELHLVPIEIFFFGSQDGIDLGQFEPPDPSQVVPDLPLFVEQLVPIAHMLPFTAATDPKMFTDRLCPFIR